MARPTARANGKAPTDTYTVNAVDRALTLLETLAEHPDLGVTELARLTGSTKSQVFRLLHTLERRQFVRKDPVAATYGLGLTALVVGERARHQTDLVRLAQPHLDALAEATRENVNLTIREGLSAVCIDMRRSPQPLQLYADLGRAAPLHVGGGPRLLLAFAPDAVVEAVLSRPLERFTSKTETKPEAVRRALARIRKLDLNESKSDLDADAFSFAAPVRDHSGTVVAALSVAGPMSRLTPATADRHRALVRDHAEALSRALGWRPAAVIHGAGAAANVRHR